MLDPAAYGRPSVPEGYRLHLVGLGISLQVVDPGRIRPISASYGALQRWEFTASPTGRAVLRRAPRAAGLRFGPLPGP